jgi:hypothetical protein
MEMELLKVRGSALGLLFFTSRMKKFRRDDDAASVSKD